MDPIEEHGGINLYGYVDNSPINPWDPFGLWDSASGNHSTDPGYIPTGPGAVAGMVIGGAAILGAIAPEAAGAAVPAIKKKSEI